MNLCPANLSQFIKRKKFKITGLILPKNESKCYGATIQNSKNIKTLFSDD